MKWLEMYRLLKFLPDAHHFYLGFCAGLLCVGCILPHDFSLSGVHPNFLNLDFNSCSGRNVCLYLLLILGVFYFQVIALTEEILATAKQNENFVSAISISASTSETLQNSNRIAQYEMVFIL